VTFAQGEATKKNRRQFLVLRKPHVHSLRKKKKTREYRGRISGEGKKKGRKGSPYACEKGRKELEREEDYLGRKEEGGTTNGEG